MDDVIGDRATDDVGASFGVIYGASEHQDCDCDVGWCGNEFFGDCSAYYYYYYFIIINYYYYLLILHRTNNTQKYKYK